MGRLSLALLGLPEARIGRRLLAFPTRKALALLAYLAVEPRTHSREQITSLFWPESASSAGRATLRSTLAYLRGALGDARGLLAADRETLRLEAGGLDVDVAVLMEAARAARQQPLLAPAGAAAPLRPLVQKLHTALALYRGDFLAGFSLSDAPEFDNWASLQRESLHRQAGLVFDRLSQLQSEGGEPAAAIETTLRWVAHDPLDETAHRRLMQLHAANGDLARALQAYDACRALLERELSAEPAPETEALAARLRAQSRQPHGAASPALARDDSGGYGTPAGDAPLVGRLDEHQMLVRLYRQVRRGTTRVAVLEGEPGIGKSRLAREFMAWAAGQGADLLAGRAYEAGARLPYQPLVEALRDGLRVESEPRALLSDTWLVELSRLLPELLDRAPGLPAPQPWAEAEARTRLYEAVARFGLALAQRGPLLLFVDDLQWADAATLDLLQYAAHRWRLAAAPVLLLLAVRTEDVATTPALSDWLAGLGHDLPLTRLSLGTLAAADLVQLLRATGISETTLPAFDAFCRQLFADSGGHPFFVLQTLRSLLESGALVRSEAGNWSLAIDGDGGFPVARGVRELVAARLGRLDAEAGALVSAAAVLGSGFDFDTLLRVSGQAEPAGLAALDSLLARGLLREQGPSLNFAHDRLREVAYAELSQARRVALHRRALEALPGPPAELAHHALAAGLDERAFELLAAAGDDALRVFAIPDAIKHYEAAQALAVGGPVARERLLRQLGHAYEMSSEWSKARAAYEALLSAARARREPGLESAALSHLANVAARSTFDLGGAAALLQQAQQVAAAADDRPALVETEFSLAQIGLYHWDAAEILEHGGRALSIARELGQPALIARCLNALAYSGTISGEWEAMAALAQELADLYAGLGNQPMQADNLALVGAFQVQSGHLAAGLAAARQADALSREIDNGWGQANNGFYLAHALMEVGEYGQALEAARRCVGMARMAAHAPLLVFNLQLLGAVYRALFALPLALEAHQEAWQIGLKLRQPFIAEWTPSTLCADYAVMGDWAAAHTRALQAVEARAHNQAVTAFAGLTRHFETEALARGGSAETAEEDLGRFDSQTAEKPRYRIAFHRAVAALAEQRGDSAEAMGHLQAAAEGAEQMALPGETWAIQAALNGLYEAMGAAEQAREAAARAAEVVRALAQTIGDAALEEGFLAAEPVRKVLGE